jgi:hypothetical protein
MLLPTQTPEKFGLACGVADDGTVRLASAANGTNLRAIFAAMDVKLDSRCQCKTVARVCR